MPEEVFLFLFYNPYTGQQFKIFAPDYECAITELGRFTEYSGVCQLLQQEDLQNLLEDSED